jgi:hypothetical protein
MFRSERRTVDGDGNAFTENIAISANKGWNFSKLVDELVVSWSGSTSIILLDNVKLETVGFSDKLDGGGTRVVLKCIIAC